jgi:hypothetical protein
LRDQAEARASGLGGIFKLSNPPLLTRGLLLQKSHEYEIRYNLILNPEYFYFALIID